MQNKALDSSTFASFSIAAGEKLSFGEFLQRAADAGMISKEDIYVSTAKIKENEDGE